MSEEQTLTGKPLETPSEEPKKKSRRTYFDRVAAGEEIVPWTVKPLRDLAENMSLKQLAEETLKLQTQATWLAWKIIYCQDLAAKEVPKRAAAAWKLAALTIDHPLLRKLAGKDEKKKSEPVKVTFSGNKR